jgi:hypothetical protein
MEVVQRDTLSNQPPRAEIAIVAGFSDLGISGPAESELPATKSLVIGTAASAWRRPRSR